MFAYVVAFVAYFIFASIATYASWRTHLRWTGFMLMITCVLTNTLGSLWLPSSAKPALEMLFAVLIAGASTDAWSSTGPLPKSTIAIIWLSIIDVCFCLTISAWIFYSSDKSSNSVPMLYYYFTNAIFIGQCLCLISPGLRNVVVARNSNLSDMHYHASENVKLQVLFQKLDQIPYERDK